MNHDKYILLVAFFLGLCVLGCQESDPKEVPHSQEVIHWKKFEACDQSFTCMVPDHLRIVERKSERRYEVFIGKSINMPEYCIGFQTFDDSGREFVGKQQARLLLRGPWDQHSERVPSGTERSVSRDGCDGTEQVFEYESGRRRKFWALATQKRTRTYFFYADDSPKESNFWNSISIESK